MGRSPKKGLDYFKKTVDYYSDDKIMDLMDEYGPLGVTIYDVILTIIYKNGYYLEMPVEKLSRLVRRTIGNRWIKDITLVGKVIDYCAEIGLFDECLMQQNIMTSVGIQSRYAEVTARNKVDKSNYWLLRNGEALSSDAFENISATEKEISATEITINGAAMQQNKTIQDDSISDMYNSYYNCDNDENCMDVYDSLNVEEQVKIRKKCGILMYTEWCRPATLYDYKQAASVLNLLHVKTVKKPLKVISEDYEMLLTEAINIAASAGAAKWSYVSGIFRNWSNTDVKTYDDYVKYSETKKR